MNETLQAIADHVESRHQWLRPTLVTSTHSFAPNHTLFVDGPDGFQAEFFMHDGKLVNASADYEEIDCSDMPALLKKLDETCFDLVAPSYDESTNPSNGWRCPDMPEYDVDMQERVRAMNAKTFKAGMREKILAHLQTYIDEAEHQDGFGYWENFDDLDEGIADFVLYLRVDQDIEG